MLHNAARSEKLNSTAFLALGSFTLIPNDNFTVASSVVYDKSGNIVAALPSYKTQVLTVSDNISINDYAFILSEYPQTVRNYCDTLSVGKYSLGYSFNGAFQKMISHITAMSMPLHILIVLKTALQSIF